MFTNKNKSSIRSIVETTISWFAKYPNTNYAECLKYINQKSATK